MADDAAKILLTIFAAVWRLSCMDLRNVLRSSSDFQGGGAFTKPVKLDVVDSSSNSGPELEVGVLLLRAVQCAIRAALTLRSMRRSLMLTTNYMSVKTPRTEMPQSLVRLLFGRTRLDLRPTACLLFFGQLDGD